MAPSAPVMNVGPLATEAAELGFADEAIRLSVRTFTIHEGIDRLFEVLVIAGSSDPELDLDRVAGHAAVFRLANADGAAPLRAWSGLCREIEQIGAEEGGLSLYLIRIVPEFWRLTQRATRRIFQHATGVEIALSIAKEWGLEAEVRLQGASLPTHDYRVQLDETDFAFACRQLEEAGVSYWFEPAPPRTAGGKLLENMKLVFGVEPQRAAPKRAELPVRPAGVHVDAEPHVRDVRISRSVRPGRFSLRGYEFRGNPELQLLADAQAQHELERRYELYRYEPKAFLSEGADGRDHGAVLDERAAAVAAQLGLERERTGRITVRFSTNVTDLVPGTVTSIAGHPRAEVCHPGALLVVAAEWHGHIGGDWHIGVEALPAREPYRARLATPKPRALGVESATVVGPPGGGEDIHTDEFGRVKVHFHWDREGKLDGNASSWLRVSQAWAGNGFGMMQLPRVGTEVLVGFFEGDPDQPLVVGQAFNRVANPPYPLPQNRTKTVWRSNSTPGGDGFNELSFEDKHGEEVVHVRAQRDLEFVTLNDERASVGANRHLSVRRNDRQVVGGDRSEVIHGAHSITVSGRHTEVFEGGAESRSGRRSGITMEDGKIVISNGQASIVLDGPVIRIDSASNIWLRSDRLVNISSKKVMIDKNVAIDQHEVVPPDVAQLAPPPAKEPSADSPPKAAPVADKLAPPGEAPFDSHKFYEELLAKAGIKVKLPKNLPLPPEVNEQLEHVAVVAHKAGIVKGELLDPKTYSDIKARVHDRLEAEKARLTAMGDNIRSTFEKDRAHIGDLAGKLGDRYALEKANLASLRTELGDIFSGKKGNFIESAKALYGVFKEQRAHIMALRDDIVALIDQEKRWVHNAVGEWTEIGKQVQGYLDGMKELVCHPKDALLDIALGPDRKLGKDLASLAGEFGKGDEVAEFFGLATPSAESASASGLPGLATSGAHLSFASSAGHIASAPSMHSFLAASPSIHAPVHAPVVLASPSGGSFVARAGGLASHDVSAAVGPNQVGFLQSPSEGQLMVIPTEHAAPLSDHALKTQLVDAQLAGHAPHAAMSDLLHAQGYAVYQRPWGDWTGSFVQAVAAEAKV